jgi:hypothetical protein
MKYNVFMEAMRMESMGFAFGEPWRPSESAITCVVPILRDCEDHPQYLILAKAKKVKISDTGSISKVRIINEEELPVFVRTGELFKGATQERASTCSQIIMPGEKLDIPVVCVHASKGIRAGAELFTHGYVPGRESLFMQHHMGKRSFGQTNSWAADRAYTTSVYCSTRAGSDQRSAEHPATWGISGGSSAGSDDLTKARDKANELFKDLIAKVPLFHNQIGMAIINDRGFHSLDCYDLHASWKDVKEAIVGKEVIALSQEDNESVFAFHPDRASRLIKSVLEVGYTEKELISRNGVKIIGLEGNDYIGEVVLLNEEVIHLFLGRN